MGNLPCSDKKMIKKIKSQKSHQNTKSKTVSAIKLYNFDSSILRIEFEIWPGQWLPNLRDQMETLYQNYWVDQEGVLEVDPKKNLDFKAQPIKESVRSNRSFFSSNSCEVEDTDLLNIKVRKDKEGYVLNFDNPYVYELVSKPCELMQGSSILVGGTEYKFLKLIEDKEYAKNKIKTMTELKGIVNTRAYLQSFSEIETEGGQQSSACRICMDSKQDKKNPLVSLCDCTGSVSCIHLKCWTDWAFSSEVKNENVYIANIVKEECELCKKSLATSEFYRENVAAVLSSYANIEAPFLVLEGVRPKKSYPYYRNTKINYVILSFANKKRFTVGRVSSCDVKLTLDSSISRENSALSYDNGKVFISDLNSKHGTYVKVKGQTCISDNSERNFLHNNSLLKFKIGDESNK